ncbi:MAG: hypothetical protein HUK24_00320 [Sphaerochaetaceae bacterium]|nr:hypothetical protein [Sphaerochaetaceae bacterium]
MNKVFLILLSLLLIFTLSSCNEFLSLNKRVITLVIPSHPCEGPAKTSLWYTLKWNKGDNICSIHVPQDVRSLTIEINIGETVAIVAYPLGELNPIGLVITPLDSLSEYTLSFTDGFLANLFLSSDLSVVKNLNYKPIKEALYKDGLDNWKLSDIRTLDKVRFLQDILNGELSKSSIKFQNTFLVSSFSLPNGIWVSEYPTDKTLYVTDMTSKDLYLPEGVFHYFNSSQDRILTIAIDSQGNTFHYLRRNFI